MSRNARLQVHLKLGRQVSQLTELPLDGLCCSSDIRSLVDTLDAGKELSQEDMTLLGKSEILQLAVAGGVSQEFEAFLQDSHSVDSHVIDVIGNQLARLERQVLTSMIEGSLSEGGWTICTAQGENANGVEAWFEEDLMLVEITDNFEINIDQSAPSGNCADHLEKLICDVEAQGAIIVRKIDNLHGNGPSQLIIKAARTNLGLAQGVASATKPRIRPKDNRISRKKRPKKILTLKEEN